MNTLEIAKNRARAMQARVVLPESEDTRIAQAAQILQEDGLAQVVPLAEASPAHINAMMALRALKPALAERMLTRPLIRAAAMVGAGEADVLVAGVVNPTKKVIEAASLAIGLADGCQTPSSFFLMQFTDERALLFADCALNVDPDEVALANIARATAASAKALLGRADVALLSYSTGRSGAGKSVEKVRAVAEATGFNGPVQADAALNTAISELKGVEGGPANTLIFPDLDAGNIAYKLVQELAGAQAIGPVLQGFRHPVCDLSRGATVDDIVASTVISIAISGISVD